jgi:RNA polymerase primary sigma factor
MATKSTATAEKTTRSEETTDSPLLDTLGTAVKKMLARGKERGFVTYDELNTVLPPEQVSSEQIEDTMTQLSEMGIDVVENEEGEEAAKEAPAEETEEKARGNVNESDLGRTDDPVRMYLREMGTVDLLSREGEIAIAKRIEAGRKMMIGGICENPLTIRAIVTWHDALVAEEMLLRDIIDLDATHGGGPGQAPNQGQMGVAQNGDENANADNGDKVEEVKEKAPEKALEANKPAAPGVPGAANDSDSDEDDDENEEQNLSLAALEAKLTPDVVETFEKINKTYKKLHKSQNIRLEAIHKGDEVKPAQEKRYGKLRHELIELMEGVHLNNARIEQLMEQLYGLNRALITAEGKLLRMATNSKIKRDDFLEQYRGTELDPGWMKRTAALETVHHALWR